MNFWIFQAVSDRYDLREIGIIKTGKKVTWYATRYRSRMSIGDTVFFWLGGTEDIRGIYGRGKLISTPYKKPEWDAYGIDVEYEQRVDPHVSVQEIRKIEALQDLLILRAPQATNFLLTTSEGRAIMELVALRKKGV
jgi:hypothetical protein